MADQTVEWRKSQEPLAVSEVQPLLDWLYAPQSELQISALRVLVQLPLGAQAWVWLSCWLDEKVKSAVDVDAELVQLAGAVPGKASTRLLRQLVESQEPDLRWQAGLALARRRDARSGAELVEWLGHSDVLKRRATAAELAKLASADQSAAIAAALKNEVDRETRFWESLALGRVGDSTALTEVLERIAHSQDELPFGEQAFDLFCQRLAASGPYSAGINEAFEIAAGIPGASVQIKAMTRAVKGDTRHEPEATTPEKLSQAELSLLENKARSLTAKLIGLYPSLDAARLFFDERATLRYLSKSEATRLITGLANRLANPPANRPHEIWAGDLLVLLAANLATPLEPDVRGLRRISERLKPGSSEYYQLAWLISWAAPRALLSGFEEALRYGDDTQSQANLALLDLALRYQHNPDMPLRGLTEKASSSFGIFGQAIAEAQSAFISLLAEVVKALNLPAGGLILESFGGGSLQQAWENAKNFGMNPGSGTRIEAPVVGTPDVNGTSVGSPAATAGGQGGYTTDWGLGNLGQANVFRAFPRLDAPPRVDPGAEFVVTAGFGDNPDVNLLEGGQIEINNPPPGASLLVLLTSEQVDFLDGFFKPLPLDLSKTAVFRCRPKADVGLAMITAHYTYNGQTVSVATRPIIVAAAPNLAGLGAQAVNTTPSTNAGAQPQALQEPANPCRMNLTADMEPVDLEIKVLREGETLTWIFQASGLNPPPVKSALSDAAAFSSQLIQDLRALNFSGALAANALRKIGQAISDIMPWQVFDLLTQVGAQVKRPPVVMILTNEPYIPWELALLEEPLDATLPPYLGAQCCVGRWYLSEKVVMPPPAILEIASLSAVAHAYGSGTGNRALPEAVNERATLQASYQAEGFDGTQAEIARLATSGKPEHLVHFSLHGNDKALMLGDRTNLPPGALVGNYRCGQPPRYTFVFMNACMVGTPNTFLGQAAGFPGDLIRGGVQGFIAPLWEVHDGPARVLAEGFYKAAFEDGISPAEYLRQQRCQYDENGTTTPMAYLYYGHPKLRMQRKAGLEPPE